MDVTIAEAKLMSLNAIKDVELPTEAPLSPLKVPSTKELRRRQGLI